MEVAGSGEGCEDFTTGHEVSPVHGLGLGGVTGGCVGLDPLRERLAVDHLVLDDSPPELFTAFLQKRLLIGIEFEGAADLADQQGGGDVHIERQAGRRAVPAQFFGCQGVADEVGAESAGILWDRDGEQACFFEILPILERKDGLPVDFGRPSGEAGPEFRHLFDDLHAFRRTNVSH